MKFLTFTDLHEDKRFIDALIKRAKLDDIDFMVCCGDISNFGKGLRHVLKEFSKVGKAMYIVPGNHEEGLGFDKVVNEFSYCHNLHESEIKIGDYVFLGYGTGGFEFVDPNFRKIARKWYGEHKGKKIVLITHQPIFGNATDLLDIGHVGSKDILRFVKRINPKLVVSGHLHETNGQIDSIGKTKLINPGWEGMVVELAD